MAWGKRTDNVLWSSPNVVKNTPYIPMDNYISDSTGKDNLKVKLDFELFNFLDNFENQFDFINFENDDFIPLEYDFDKILNKFAPPDLKINRSKFLAIIFREGSTLNSISTKLSQNQFDKVYEKINKSCKDSIKNLGLVNTYLVLGSIKYNNDYAPCILIPIFVKKDHYSCKIYRNYNQEIQFNIILKLILEEDGFEFPEFNGDIYEFINKLDEMQGIEYKKDAFISNFDLRYQHIFHDVNMEKWKYPREKIDLSLNNKDTLTQNEFVDFKNDLKKNAEYINININHDYLFLKSLLSQKKSILIITNKSTRKHVKSLLSNNGFDTLLLSITGDMQKKDFYKSIISNNLVNDDKLIDLDNLVKKYEILSETYKLINNSYLNSYLSPIEIKKSKDYYLNKLNSLNIKNYSYPFDNVANYDDKTFEKMEIQIKKHFSIYKKNFYLFDCFSMEYLQSKDFKKLVKISSSLTKHLDKFISINKEISEKYMIKIFNDLFSVNSLDNIKCLDKNPVYIEKNDIGMLNQFIKEFYISGIERNEKLAKYFKNKDVIFSIDNNIQFTELIDESIIDENSIDVILNDYDNALNSMKYLMDYAEFILKELLDIVSFYYRFDIFDIDLNLLNLYNSIEDLKKLASVFKKDIDKLVSFKDYYLSLNFINNEVEKFTEFLFKNEFKESEIIPIFRFNIYNSLLNNFLNDFDSIDETKLISEYESEFKRVDKLLAKNKHNLLNQLIYSKPLELNAKEVSIIQKERLIRNYNKGELESIKSMLKSYKEFITANKRIFMMDIASVSQFLNQDYESYFDHVIITKNVDLYKLDKISLLLRSKSKIIELKE